ncbi:hypothetical protein ID867_16555 [Streptomyces parvulus]|nr:hypothetical protein [Streptomyces parvulus]
MTVRLHDPLPGPAARRAFTRHVRHLTRIDHPHVVTVLDGGVEEDVPYVVMEYLDGIALNALARSNGRRLPAPLTVSVGRSSPARSTPCTRRASHTAAWRLPGSSCCRTARPGSASSNRDAPQVRPGAPRTCGPCATSC